MHSVVGFTVFGVDWEFLKPYIVLGLALGGVYALSGVGLVVLYQTTGVLNLAFGAIGAAGALIAYYLIEHTGRPTGSRSSRASRSAGSSACCTASCSAPPSRARPARQDDGDARPGADPARADGLARPDRRRLRTLPDASDLEPPLRAPRGDGELDAGHRARARHRAHRLDDVFLRSRSSARRCGRSRTTARSPRRSACRCGGSRPRPGSARASSAAPPGCCSPTSSRRSTTPR